MGSIHLSQSTAIASQHGTSSQGGSGPIQSKTNDKLPTSGNRSPKSNSHGEENEVLTSSMQSLVNGLMNWGGQYDDDEDFALPTGMAASIALEESCVLGVHSKIA